MNPNPVAPTLGLPVPQWTTDGQGVYLELTETQKLMEWADAVAESEDTIFHQGQAYARRLGAHYRADGLTEFGFWTPELAAEVIQSERTLELEILTPLQPIDFRADQQTVDFRRERLPVMQQGEYVWAVVAGLTPGTRDQAGCFYWLRYVDPEGREHPIRDPLAYSLPYGVFAPAELYDMDRIQRERADLAYLQQTSLQSSDAEEEAIPRLPPPTNILQIHVKTASPEGSVEGLTRIYRTLSDKLAAGEALTPAEMAYVGYEAVQLLPVEPTIEYRREDTNLDHEFFAVVGLGYAEDAPSEDATENAEPITLTVTLRQPNTQNWGYDVPILGSAATNPAVLGSLRPDEMVDLIATLHNFSQGPIQVIYDLVYGHADNQALELLPQQFFKGPNMYGQDLNHQLPQVRAILLEMQRRKINTGVDGIRVDGGQDFRFFNPLSGRVEHDDMYLIAMSDVVQEIEGYQRLMFTIFEDGRPWPEEGWEEKSTYRELMEAKPGSFQWGPLIFAHNTPTLKGFWDYKWRRVCEVITQGDHWITGCGNHDTVRRGNQIDPNADINWNLGDTLPNALNRAYNNPATLLWVYGFSPGLPMDFLNACLETPWGFFRNTDDRYGVKVAAEEVGFLDWEIEPNFYDQPDTFPQLKALGFDNLTTLRSFAKALQIAMVETDYDLEAVAQLCQGCLGQEAEGKACAIPALKNINQPELPDFLANLDVPRLKQFAMAFMEDGHDSCNVTHSADRVDSNHAAFSLALRQFRQARPWLRHNLSGSDRFNRISEPTHTLFYGHRTQPTEDGDTHTAIPAHGQSRDQVNSQVAPQEVVLITHMGGDPVTVTLGDWLQLDLNEWQVALSTPGLAPDSLQRFEIKDGEGLLLIPRA
ncbi:glucosylglycerol hydrolase [Leptolyngbya sp. BL0902]|uniref:glucosylglycerol hydrolase n=1 Tax=Leptolyngbya sp. BL0902 TaxID=1115757 RepID=UPI002938FEEF|nr:glucosylglycerol hydrolase [Leptolyngbya sp. BL0902]